MTQIICATGCASGTQIYLTSIWLAMVAHGGDFGNHFRQQISDTYETIYGSGLSAKQLDVALETEANADSAGFVSLFR